MDLIEKYIRSIDKSLQRIADSMKKIERDIQLVKAPLVIQGREISEEVLEMWKNSTSIIQPIEESNASSKRKIDRLFDEVQEIMNDEADHTP